VDQPGGLEPDFTDRVFHFLCSVGEQIVRFPNKMFYAILIILSVLVPLIGIFILISILCKAYRRW